MLFRRYAPKSSIQSRTSKRSVRTPPRRVPSFDSSYRTIVPGSVAAATSYTSCGVDTAPFTATTLL